MVRISCVVGVGFAASLASAGDVLVFSSGLQVLDDAVVSTLQAGGHAVTLGPQYFDFDGTMNLEPFDALYLQANANWNISDMPVAGQLQIADYVKGGGGLVTCEWAAFKWAGNNMLGQVMPAAYAGFVTVPETTYTKATPDAVLNAGLPDAFSFPQGSFTGSEASFVLKQGAVSYFTSSATIYGVVGWGVQQGRVLSLSTVAANESLADADFRKLLVNAIYWAAEGGCIADCNGNGSLNILDFVCFQQKFQAGEQSADINGDGNLNILDFVAFQQKFQQGCG
jgi:hypothetical protein